MRLFRGWLGEKVTAFVMWRTLDSHTYRSFHNLIIPSGNGTTQIDHLLISPYGLFIVETKYRTGWIFGSADKPKWTQTLRGKKYSFQNPLRQTFRQKKLLAEYLKVNESMIHTVVCFVGDCTFKTQLPSNVINSKLGRYIQHFNQRILSARDIAAILHSLNKHVSESKLTSKDHVQSLRERHSSNTICPNCGSDLVIRTTRKGINIGSQFLGCTKYPKCRFTKNVTY